MKLWAKTKEFFEGKYLVVRRDGTIPPWPHFVLGGDDPCGPDTLRAYVDSASQRGFDPDFVESIYELANDWEHKHRTKGNGVADPDAAPHRKDNQAVLSLMRHEMDLSNLEFTPHGMKAYK